MKTSWTYSHSAPVRGLRVRPDGDIVVLDDLGGHLLLGLDGAPVAGSRRAPVAGLAQPARRRGPYDIVTDGDRLTLLLDDTELDETQLDGTVTAVATAWDGAVVVAGTEEGTVYGLRPPLTEAGAMTLLDKEQDLMRSPDATMAGRAAHLYLDTGSACFAVRRMRQLEHRGALPSEEGGRWRHFLTLWVIAFGRGRERPGVANRAIKSAATDVATATGRPMWSPSPHYRFSSTLIKTHRCCRRHI
ncbi:SAM-dependent methyltransferase, partial [Streptomyces sp. G35A]